MTDFKGLGLIEPLSRAVASEGYTIPTPIQAGAIPALLQGKDLLGVAQTGTGKTAAFVLPMLQRLHEMNAKPARKCPRALILAPTRELAVQIDESVNAYGRHMGENGQAVKSIAIFGGVPIPKQAKALGDGVLVLTATPGRLMDLLNQDKVRLNKVEIFVLDEADRMLDMGFINDVRKVSKLVPDHRQTVLFSATMPKAVTELAHGLMDSPVRVEVAPQSTTAERVQQVIMHVPKAKKRDLLSHVMKDDSIFRAVVFTRTKHGADRVSRHLTAAGVKAGAIHGDKAQNQRQRTLQDFRASKLRVLVATDIAARGIDIDDVTHVINFDMPNEAESYVHRIGRTARAGNDGLAISFCDEQERGYLKAVEKITRQSIPVNADHPFHAAAMAMEDQEVPKRGGGNRPPRLRAQNAPQGKKSKAPKGKGHRPTDGKSHSDKGHGGHGHGEPQGHGSKKQSSKGSGQKQRSAPKRDGANQGGGHKPLKARRSGGSAAPR